MSSTGSFDGQTLFNLLPTIYRVRDDALAQPGQAGPLRSLMDVIAAQAGVVEDNVDQLYDDLFIDTCSAWVVPYIGDLIGVRPLNGKHPAAVSDRAEVGHTISYRRRKGTAAMLEQLARDVTGWPAHVVEYFQLLATDQFMNHIRICNFGSPDLRKPEPLERINTAFDRTTHCVDVRQISRGGGQFNIRNIGIFLCRLQPFSMTGSQASSVDARRFRFSPLGNDLQLFNSPPPAPVDVEQLVTRFGVPLPITRYQLNDFLPQLYGPGLSILLTVGGNAIDISQICAANLSDSTDGSWAHQPVDLIAIDPVLGRIAFPSSQPPPVNMQVNFNYGFSAEMGGGEYERSPLEPDWPSATAQIPAGTQIQDSLTTAGNQGVLELSDSYTYSGNFTIDAAGSLELRAGDAKRPIIQLNGDLVIRATVGETVILDGLTITGGAIQVPDDGENLLTHLTLRHCTLVPGISLTGSGEPVSPQRPSLVVALPGITVEIDNCITGPIQVVETSSIELTNSIVDAMDTRQPAISGDAGSPGAELSVTTCTIRGRVVTRLLTLASDSIFLSDATLDEVPLPPVVSSQKQKGCIRFCFMPWGSRVPRRFRCQPDLALEKRAKQLRLASPTGLSPGDLQMVQARVRPVFTSFTYGTAGYAQIASTGCEIRRGASDESEMGAFHDLYQPQRVADLRVRLKEYLRFGMEAGIFFST